MSRLGAGGMGEVYLAHDEHLERRAAVKILPAKSHADTDSIRRFTQEAKAAAALNHPNIAHIYDAGQFDGVPYLAMEYVEGETLNTLTPKLPLPAEELLRIAMQVADALVEAHAKGIVHRDIKPSNLIRNSRSQVKVLDFGLAKLSAAAKVSFATTVSSGATTDSAVSQTNVAVGSLPYMSPEQALAKDIDARTDVFSLGAVLYELGTGRRPFAGQTPAALFDAILNRTPPNPRTLNPDLPEPLDRIIRKCLEKEADLRYQTAQDLLADLKLAQRDLTGGGTTQQLVRAPRRSWPLLALATAVVLLSAYLGWRTAQRNPQVSSVPLRTVPLTSFPGSETQPSFSPDGNQVAFAWNQNKEDDLDIWVKVVEAGMPLQLTKTPAQEYSPSWSPDGKYIAFLRQTTETAGFYLIPALGGLERKLADASSQRVGADAPFISWSPDGKQLVLVDRDSPTSPLSLYLLDMEGNNRRKLTNPPVNTLGDSSPTFSPDGNSIVYVRTTSLAIQDIYTVNVQDGAERRLTQDNRRIYGIAWNPADGSIIFSSGRNARSRLWRLSPRGGAAEALPGIGDQAGYLGISRNGQRLAYSRSVIDTNIWRYQMPERLTPTPVGEAIMVSTRHEQGPRFSPDGKRVTFASNRSGSLEIWVADANGERLNQLTVFNGPPTGSPMWSPDGKFIVFDSRPGGNPDVYVVSADGGLPRRLTTDASEEIVPSWSRDGKWIYFASNRTGRFELWKMPAAGGAAVQVTRQGAFHGVESPDGKFVLYAKGTNSSGLWRVPVDGGAEQAAIEGLRAGYWSYWSFGRDSSGVYYLDREDLDGGGARYPLRWFPFGGGRESTVTYLARRPFNSGLSVSPDGKWFLYTQVDQSETDIMLVDGFH